MSTIDLIAQTLYDKKSFNILALDVKGLSTLADTFIIAEGSVARHVVALADYVEEALAKTGEHALYTEGKTTGDWVVLDYGDYIIHLFTPESREKYALEELWHEAQIIDLDIDINHQESSP
jgi:ribosome-associated protein